MASQGEFHFRTNVRGHPETVASGSYPTSIPAEFRATIRDCFLVRTPTKTQRATTTILNNFVCLISAILNRQRRLLIFGSMVSGKTKCHNGSQHGPKGLLVERAAQKKT